MADNPNTNPFLDDNLIEDDLIEDEIEPVDPPISQAAETSPEITVDTVAAKLLRDNFILTALELHTELIESGRDLPRLRDYFSNPGNFERTKSENTSPTLPRTSSVQTFDSLDFARYSDDGERQVDERFAVLEFELRKAQETIKSLRASLTKEAETELPSPERGDEESKEGGVEEPIRPLERRALNFLVNEYMLRNNYKLTSVTFAEENEDQDFEDWDDVGLNIPKPPDVLRLYRDYANHVIPTTVMCDAECEADIEDIHFTELQAEWEHVREDLLSQVTEVQAQVDLMKHDNNMLKTQLDSLSKSPTKSTSTPLVTPINTPVKKLADGQLQSSQEALLQGPEHTSHSEQILENLSEEQPDRQTQEDSHVSQGQETGSEISPAVGEDNCEETELTESESLQVEVGSELRESVTEFTSNFEDLSSSQMDSVNERLGVPDCTNRKMSPAFRKALLNVSFYVQKDNRIVSELSKLGDSDKEKVVQTLARCLPHIVPNVLLAKREELIPLILCTATLHSDPSERDKLLNILFNLIKKPDEEQRQMILTGCIAFAENAGQTRVEAELLPQCWEQISHKYIERRLLVAEACGALAPHVPNDIRSSLLLSMLKQMLMDDKAEEVREAVVKSLGLVIGFIGDRDKYIQGLEMLMSALNDASDRVVTAAQLVFLPSFALWAYELGKLEHDLANVLLRKMEELVKAALAMQKTTNSTTLPLDENKFVFMIKTLKEVVPFLYLSMLETGPFAGKVETVIEEAELIDPSRFPKPASSLTDLRVIVGDHHHLSALVHLFDQHMDQEWVEPWENYSWVVNNLIPRLIEIVGGVGLTLPKIIPALSSLFYAICRTFGPIFTEKKVKPRFKELLAVPEELLYTQVTSGQTALTTCTVPVYTSGVLTAFSGDESQKQLTQFLQETLTTMALCQAPLDSLKATFQDLGSTNRHHDVLLGVLWDGVVHTSAQVRCVAARLFELLIRGLTETELSTRVIPALVTLANDPEISVRVSTIPALGTIIENVAIREMLDRVYMQLQTFLDDPMYRDQHAVHVELIRMFSRVAPNSEPKFRDEFVLPRLAAMAQANNNITNETKKRDIAMQLFEAYSALSCCFLNDQLVQEAMLPGLRCLKQDMAEIAADHEEVVQSMIREFETRLETTRHPDRSSSFTPHQTSAAPSGLVAPSSGDDMRARVMNRIKDTTARANIANIFGRKK